LFPFLAKHYLFSSVWKHLIRLFPQFYFLKKWQERKSHSSYQIFSCFFFGLVLETLCLFENRMRYVFISTFK
jgi:hypothetical protein